MARFARGSRGIAGAFVSGLLVACSGATGEAPLDGVRTGCDGGTTTSCTCEGGREGTRTCEDGTYGACVCSDDAGSFDVSADVPDVPPKCGDLACNGAETCETCPTDCGKCPKCDLAPSCTGAIAVPTTSTELDGFDNEGKSLYVCGVGMGEAAAKTTCLDPRLRMRIRQIKIAKNGVWPGSLDMYCIVHASDGATSEIAVTPLQKDLGDDHAPLVFDPNVALFWGQKELRPTINNLTITYKCFRNVDNSAYTSVFGTIKDEAIKAGGVAGPWGWAFGLGGVAAGIVEAAVGSSGGDTLRLSVQQTIDAGALLDLTNGRIWQIRQSGEGGGLNGKWDWTVEIEAWGCADARVVPK